MTNTEKNRIQELKQLIAKYDKQYYEEGVSEISDSEYDRLYEEYLAFEEKYPELKDMKDAPTKRVGAGNDAGTTTAFPKFTHKSPLLSIDRKAKELSELKDFYEKVGGDGTEVIIEPKLDGITVNINYENGKFVNAATRGNGYIGDLITENFKMTDTKYPDKLSDNASIELRGEAIIPYDYFTKHLMNDYSNPRNAVAGIMRQIESKDVKNKGVQVMFYDFGETENVMKERNDSYNIDFIKALGFGSVPVEIADTWEKLEKIVVSKMHERIQNIDGFNVLVDDCYPQAVCDGLVIKVNDRQLREEIGMSEKGPKWALAFKFKPLQMQTRIDHVEWQTGKSGRLTPVAVFDEISLGGVNITRATLNNYDYMKNLSVLNEYRMITRSESYDTWQERHCYGKNMPFDTIEAIHVGDILEDLKPEESQGEMKYIKVSLLSADGFWIEDIQNEGNMYCGEWYPFEENRYCLIPNPGLKMDDIIIVERSNDVIPRIIGILNHQNIIYQQDMEITKKVQERKLSFEAPTVCPDCGGKVTEQYPLHFCTNNFCPSQMKGKIEHYTSRDALNIVGLGEGIINTLYGAGYLPDIPSIYTLASHKTKLESLPKFGKRKVEKLLKSIEETKTPELWQFIYALAIEGVGKKTAKDLAQRYHSLDNFLQASISELTDMQDIGEITAIGIKDYITDEKTVEMINKLISMGVKPKPVEIAGEQFKGMTFVITGTLANPRKYYQDIIEKNGGKVSGSVSKKTNVVIIGEDAGSKEEKARKLVYEGNDIIILDTEKDINEYFEL